MITICSVGGSFDVDMAEGPEGYVCAACGAQFKGIGKDLKCPKCSSDKETENEEIVLGTGIEDILCVSSLVNNQKIKPVMISTLYSLRELSFPLLILNKGHPASKRLKLVFGFGDKVILDSCIEAGTHPDQHLLCSMEELSGITIVAKKGGIEIVDPINRKIQIEKKAFELKL